MCECLYPSCSWKFTERGEEPCSVVQSESSLPTGGEISWGNVSHLTLIAGDLQWM